MKKRSLPPPATAEERAAAAAAAIALRAALADPATAGKRLQAHVLMARPRRGMWILTWENLPGFTRTRDSYTHALLPGWEYTGREVKGEMIADLEHLAATGERPKEATRHGR